MKPTRKQIENAYTNAACWNRPSSAGIGAIMDVIYRAWEADETDRARILEAFFLYAWHLPFCHLRSKPVPDINGPCTCGLWEMRERMGQCAEAGEAEDTPTVARLADDVDQFNELQRIRRTAYEEGARENDGGMPESPPIAFDQWLREVREAAARRYPLRKRVPRVLPDPHGYGVWGAEWDDNAKCWHAVWREGEHAVGWQADLRYQPFLLTLERIDACRLLTSKPLDVEESTEVEP